ncbi:MAG: glycosyltransferase family 4 protein [Verrucomicrobiae bacterium]|nr:glycosyltransferase family 4 protein [Verrucomicrobiae bacterium]
MSRIKTLFWYWGRKGGGARYAMEIARPLAQHPSLDLHLSVSRQSDFFDGYPSLPPDHLLPIDTYTNGVEALVRSLGLPLLRKRFGDFLHRHAIEVVYSPMSHLWNSAMLDLLDRPRRIPYLLTVHDARLHAGEGFLPHQWLLSHENRRADCFVVLSDHVKKNLVGQGFRPEMIRTIPHGIFDYQTPDAPAPAPRRLPDGRPVHLLFFGRILAYKGLDLLLEAFEALVHKNFPVVLTIAGSGSLQPYRHWLDRHPDRILIQNDWIAEEDIGGYFDRADILVTPYREASQSGVIPIALGKGVPIIATPVGGLAEQFADGQEGLLSRDTSAGALSGALTTLLNDPALYARLSEGALTRSRSHSWSGCADLVAGELVRLSGRKPVSGH